MKPTDFARIEAMTQRMHEKRHKGWDCEDVHPLVHANHMRAFRRQATRIVQRDLARRCEIMTAILVEVHS